jgi:predicted transcriptional regulator
MSESVVEIAKELTLALIEAGTMPPDAMQETLQKTYDTLTALKAQEESRILTPEPVSATAPVDWRKSITRHAVTCLECGQSFKQLSLRHLSMHGLDSRSYRIKYGIPRTQPLAARATTERRRQVVQKIRPWEKTPRFLQARERHGHASPELDAEAVHEAAEDPSVIVPVQPKRQPTTPKKTASKNRLR